MVNLVAGRELVPELIQHRATPAHIASTLVELLRDERRCKVMKDGLRAVKAELGPAGAVDRAATVVLDMLRVST
jgi:lipid-A-disaccharide synthase